MHLAGWLTASISVVVFGAPSLGEKAVKDAFAETAHKTPIIVRREALKDSIVVKESNPGILVRYHGGNGFVCVAHGAPLAVI